MKQRKRICKNVLRIQHQPKACASDSDLGDDQLRYLFTILVNSHNNYMMKTTLTLSPHKA